MPEVHDLSVLAEEHLNQARGDAHGRSAQLVVHDGALRQSVIALVSGTELDEHNTPPAASLCVLRGEVRLTTEQGNEWVLREGQFGEVPKERHGLVALADSVVLLTAVTATA
ncbi:cupin [Streptomyces longispororuber]|nr:cupin [Streptomyces longispororuber]